MKGNAKETLRRAGRSLRNIPLPFLGMAFSTVWLQETLPLLSPDAIVLGAGARVAFDVVMGAAALIIAAFSRRLCLVGPGRTVLPAAGCACSVAASGVLALAHETGWLWADLAFCLVGDIGASMLFLAWLELLAALNPLRCVLCYCCARLASELLGIALEGYVVPYLYGAIALLPLLSAACLVKGRAIVQDEGLPPISGARPAPFRPTALLTCCALAYALASAATGAYPGYPEKLLCAVPALLFGASIALSTRHFTLRTAYAVLCPLMMLTLLLPAVLPGLPPIVLSLAAEIGYSTSKIISILVLGGLSYRLGVSMLWLYGIAWGCSNVALGVGIGFYQMQAAVGNSYPIAFAVVVAACIAIASILVATDREPNSNWGLTATSDGETGEEAAALQRIQDVRNEFHLTDREEEILCLLAQKKTVAVIAKDMFLAEGTVKAHVSHIYQKTGVHSRAELFRLLGLS